MQEIIAEENFSFQERRPSLPVLHDSMASTLRKSGIVEEPPLNMRNHREPPVTTPQNEKSPDLDMRSELAMRASMHEKVEIEPSSIFTERTNTEVIISAKIESETICEKKTIIASMKSHSRAMVLQDSTKFTAISTKSEQISSEAIPKKTDRARITDSMSSDKIFVMAPRSSASAGSSSGTDTAKSDVALFASFKSKTEGSHESQAQENGGGMLVYSPESLPDSFGGLRFDPRQFLKQNEVNYDLLQRKIQEIRIMEEKLAALRGEHENFQQKSRMQDAKSDFMNQGVDENIANKLVAKNVRNLEDLVMLSDDEFGHKFQFDLGDILSLKRVLRKFEKE